METKNKSRTGAPRRKSPAAAKKAPASRKPLATGKRPAPKRREEPVRSKAPARSKEENARRREAARAQLDAMRAESAQLQSSAQTENIPEMVFKPTQEQSRVRTPEEAKRADMRRKSAKRSQERKKLELRRGKRPAVTYTQPKPFNLNRLLLQLTMVAAVVAAVMLGISVFFKVEKVVVYGNHAYSAWTIQEASGIEGGENLLAFGRAKACGKIKTALPYVDTVRIGINLPDTVNIYIEEFEVAYSIQDGTGAWWLMTSSGNIVEKIDNGKAGNYTKVLGVKLESPEPGRTAQAVVDLVPTEATTGEEVTESTESITVVTGKDRLDAALQILDALETNDIVGKAASVDVTSLSNIVINYDQRYEVKLGTADDIDYKISAMKAAVSQLSDYQNGILDVSFTTWTDQVGFTPYE